MRMESGQSFAAHIDEDGRVHSLSEHLEETARLAENFAAAFEFGAWGRLTGLWHDLGKFHARFQRRVRGDNVRFKHARVGAALAAEITRSQRHPLVFVIAGHHAGLSNPVMRPEIGGPTPLSELIREAQDDLESVRRLLPVALQTIEATPPPDFLMPLTAQDRMYALEFLTRFLFSALVDADYLDTEAFMQPKKAAKREVAHEIAALDQALVSYYDKLFAGILPAQRDSTLNLTREEVQRACEVASAQPLGVFSLTVPTGGGKTLAAMRFALRHARTRGLRRVIVVIPYTSIIEQNAKVYRDALGSEFVIEHHANLDPERQQEEHGEETSSRNKLAAENWDAPVIVTTSVQFFESLFANKPSRCRKLHNIAESVIVLDEIQTIPPHFLLPILDALKQLTTHYGCTVVLSTATPPALVKRPALEAGLEGVRPIVAPEMKLHKRLRRVRYQWAVDEAVKWEHLAGKLADHKAALAVVNRRQDASDLARLLMDRSGDGEVIHLSALMCPAHRLKRIEEVKQRLADELPCRLVSTQLIEAGVDLDFPVVYRALAGLDSIVQAAGRCNREGKSMEAPVYVFRPPTQPVPGVMKAAYQATELMLGIHGGDLDPSDPDVMEEYFRRLYQTQSVDSRGIMTDRAELNFANVAHNFRIIEDGYTENIVVPWGDAPERLARLTKDPTDKWRWRAVQPYTVAVYPQDFRHLQNAGAIEEIVPGLHVLALRFHHYYSDEFGLVAEEGMLPDPGQLMV